MTRWILMVCAVACHGMAIYGADELRTPVDLPLKGTVEKPLILLELGSATPSPSSETMVGVRGDVSLHDGDRTIVVKNDEVQLLCNGKGMSSIQFRFKLPPVHPSGDYTFWMRWKQGGDPNTSEQGFEVWAGTDENTLEKRAAMRLKPGGWKYAWRDGKTVAIKAGDTILEVRNRGNAESGKMFSAFLLGGPKPPPPPVELPVSGSRPVVALGFGTLPFNRPQSPAETIHSGKIATRSTNVLYASIGGDVATVAHKGYGEWGATFEFDLAGQPIPAGFYSFHARYMSGGEASQVRQTFVVKAGPDSENLGVRGVFQMVNRTPFKQQWLIGTGKLAIFPGDKVLQVVNSGKAHDVKVFEGFALGLEDPMPTWMTPERALRRSRFLAAIKQVEQPSQWLYVLDGDGDDALLGGVAEKAGSTQVKYVLGAESDQMAAELHIPVRPAAVLVNADRRVVEVTPGGVPTYPEITPPAPTALVEGAPVNWLIATGWPGQCGIGHWGLDAESQQRPNPGDLFAYGFYTAGNRSGRWSEHPVGAKGVCVITDKLTESYAWGKGTSYAVTYLHADRPVTVDLHLQHSGVESAVYLDGADQPLRHDPVPPVALPRQEAKNKVEVVERVGQEIHDDVTVPQAAQPELVTTLALDKGWHCVVLKLVNAQGKDETVWFSARATGATGIRTQTTDPMVPLGVAKAAAGLWPDLYLDGVPGNLPHPNEPLSLVADMRVLSSYVGRSCPEVFLPFSATLRVRMRDYDGKEVGVFETAGTFPSVVKVNLGKAPAAGYYALTPELVAPDGRLIHRFHPDGFSVVLGNTAQKERLDRKELWNSWYYALNDRWDTLAPWLERLGLFKNLGSMPGVPPDVEPKWEDAKARGIVLCGDFAADSDWMNNSAKDAAKVEALVPKYTRYFKTVNEIDGRCEANWVATREPGKWVERAKWQYEAVHAARKDAVYLGGSLYCSGKDRQFAPPILSPRAWLRQCLQLGLDRYIDVWDVHAYPQNPPRLEAPSIANSPLESDLGVLDVFKELAKTNTKPFILGETSAMVWHGFAGMRWQAATTAKMAAWTNSREDWLGVAFCAAHHNRRVTMEEYGMAHNPGEAALYTAGALIDGLPYRAVATDGKDIQAAYFGDTFMVWRTDEKTSEYALKLNGDGPWVAVSVVGQVRPLEVKGGVALITISTSPVYVLAKAEYERLTRIN